MPLALLARPLAGSPSSAAADSVRYAVSFPTPRTMRRGSSWTFRGGAGHAGGLDEPLVAGAVCAARVRQKRVRRAGDRLARAGADGRAAAIRIAGWWWRGAARCALPTRCLATGRTGPTRRSTRATRTSTCRRRSPGRAGWRRGRWRCALRRPRTAGGGWRRSSWAAPIRSRGGRRIWRTSWTARPSSATSRSGPGRSGKPVGPTPFASRCTTRAPTPRRTRSRRRWERWWRRRSESTGRRPATTTRFTPSSLTICRGPRATGWSIATPPCSARRPRWPKASTSCSSPRRTSSSTRGTWSASARQRSSRSTLPRRTPRTRSGSARDSPIITTGSASAAPA